MRMPGKTPVLNRDRVADRKFWKESLIGTKIMFGGSGHDPKQVLIDHIRILGIRLKLACNRGSSRGILLQSD